MSRQELTFLEMTSCMQQQAFALENLNLGLITGDAMEALKLLPSNCFNVVITSPPYFWVRDYGVKGQIGHEETLDEFISKLADVFDEVRRVLHPQGVFYLNIGDTYYSGNGQPHGSDPRSKSRNFMRVKMRPVDKSGWGIPKKTLIGIPWKLAFEMQDRGWTLRSDIIWNRGNAFSEPSARDRPWRKYEHVFLFSKNRFYSYDRSVLQDNEDVWDIPIERSKLNKEHNAPFPVKLVERCIATGCPPGGKVLDPFLGSGTTMMTAIQMGRSCVGVDLKPSYINEVIQLLGKEGARPIEWNELNTHLKSVNPEMEEWAGYLQKMRKPGRKPFAKLSEDPE
jgi:site-specific DNA-methyltransferase (adenine-specific)